MPNNIPQSLNGVPAQAVVGPDGVVVAVTSAGDGSAVVYPGAVPSALNAFAIVWVSAAPVMTGVFKRLLDGKRAVDPALAVGDPGYYGHIVTVPVDTRARTLAEILALLGTPQIVPADAAGFEYTLSGGSIAIIPLSGTPTKLETTGSIAMGAFMAANPTYYATIQPDPSLRYILGSVG